jgi:hypothetical protein
MTAREWDYPPGDAEGRSGWEDARISALDKPAIFSQNDSAALPGSEVPGIPLIKDDDGKWERLLADALGAQPDFGKAIRHGE